MPTFILKLFPFLYWGKEITPQLISKDLFAGLTGAVLALPQGIAYALIAGLPAEYGLYSAIIVCILASLFGSSHHMVSGPTAALSIVLMAVVSPHAANSYEYIQQALALTLMIGVIQITLGIFRFGELVNFISHTVVIGFTSGAAILIGASQLQHLFGIHVNSGLSLVDELHSVVVLLPQTHGLSLIIGTISLGTSVIARNINSQLPYLLIGLGIATLACFVLDGESQGVALVGALPNAMPSFSVPNISSNSIENLSSGALAIAFLGLIEAVSIARSISLRSGQSINGNQEFCGQGIANTIGACLGCFVGSGSFTRSGANFDAGAQTPLSSIFSALFLTIILFFIPTFTTYLPMPAIAGAIILISWNLLNFEYIYDILKANYCEVTVFFATFLSTLFIQLEYSIYVGVIFSLAFYFRRTARPSITEISTSKKCLNHQLKALGFNPNDWHSSMIMLHINGSLYFGSADHVQKNFHQLIPNGNKKVFLIASGVDFIDFSGAKMLEQEALRLKENGGDLIIVDLRTALVDELKKNSYLNKLGIQYISSSIR